jgi:hypothetical protein
MSNEVETNQRRAAAWAGVADVVCIVAFVALGRRSHDEGTALSGTLAVAAPFLIALVVSWVVAWRLRLVPTEVRFGVLAWIVTVALGMLLRHTVFDRSTAGTFIIVASVFLCLFLVGWRALSVAVGRRRAARRPSGTA